MNPLRHLSKPALESLAAALESGGLGPKYSRINLASVVKSQSVVPVRDYFRDLAHDGMTPAHIATMLRAVAQERIAAQSASDRVELVWSGAKLDHDSSRDTAVVVQELFREAKQSILIVSYALDTWAKAQALFGALADRMDDEPDLDVRLCVNVHRPWKDTRSAAVLVGEFAKVFRAKIWPGERLPDVYYDPRSLSLDKHERACLHAKCVVIDDRRALITSANFTEAAHNRNIEAGVLHRDRNMAEQLRRQFDTLIEHGTLVNLWAP